MNDQQAFDKMVTHAFTQKEKAIDLEGRCCYRTKCGKMCFVGAILPDEEYKPGYENRSIREFDSEITAFEGLSAGLLPQAQIIHDAYNVSNWFHEFTLLSKRFKLDPSVLNTFKEVKL